MMKARFALSWSLALIACTSPASDRQSSAWQVDSTPLLLLGSSDGDPTYELQRVSGAIRLSDGRIVVANSGTNELRFFSPDGALLGAKGRKGAGPGEYSGRMTLTVIDGDSLVIWDGGELRFSLLDSQGQFVRLMDVPVGDRFTFPWDVLLHRGAWIEGVRTSSARACATRLVRLLDSIAPTDGLRRIVFDDVGAVWVLGDNNEWRVLTSEAVELGRVSLPRGLEVYRMGLDYVLGRTVDPDGFERIALHRLVRSGPRPQPCDSVVVSDTAPSEVERARLEPMAALVRNLMTAQEMYYANYGRYADNADSLEVRGVAGLKPFLLHGDAQSWVGGAIDRRSRRGCAVGVGNRTPAGWLEGGLKCG